MLLTIHNLPKNMNHSEIKQFLLDKCGVSDIVLDVAWTGNSTKTVKIGVCDQNDANLVMQLMNGIYLGGNRLTVENMKQSQGSKPYQNPHMPVQPYNSSNSLPRGPAQSKPNNQFGSTSPWIQNVPSWPNAPNTSSPQVWDQQPVNAWPQVVNLYDPRTNANSFNRNDQFSRSTYNEFQHVNARSNDSGSGQYDVGYNNFEPNHAKQPLLNHSAKSLGHGNAPVAKKPSFQNEWPQQKTMQFQNSSRPTQNMRIDNRNSNIISNQREPMNRSRFDQQPKKRSRFDNQPTQKYRFDNQTRECSTFKNQPKEMPRFDNNQSKDRYGLDNRSRDRPRFDNQPKVNPRFDNNQPRERPRLDNNQPKERPRSVNQSTAKPWLEDRSGANKPRSINPASNRDTKHMSGTMTAEKRPNTAGEAGPAVKKPKRIDETDIEAVIKRDEAWRSTVTGNLTGEILAVYKRDHIKLSLVTLKKVLNKSIRTRIDLLMKDEVGVSCVELMQRYRKKYSLDNDIEHAKAVIAKQVAWNEKVDPANNAKKKPKVVKSQNEVKPQPPSHGTTPMSGGVAYPFIPYSDKPGFKQQKRRNKEEWAEEKPYVLEPALQKAVDDEIQVIGKLILESIAEPDEMEGVLKKKLPDVAKEIQKVSTLQLCRRVLDVRNFLTIRLTFGKKPNKEALLAFLKENGVGRFNKAARSKIMVIMCDTYESYDRLCAMKQATVGNTTIRMLPMHLTGPPPKTTRKEVLRRRQDFINRQICDYELPDSDNDIEQECVSAKHEKIEKTEKDNGDGKEIDNGDGKEIDNGDGKEIHNGDGKEIDNGDGKEIDNGDIKVINNGNENKIKEEIDNGKVKQIDNGNEKEINNRNEKQNEDESHQNDDGHDESHQNDYGYDESYENDESFQEDVDIHDKQSEIGSVYEDDDICLSSINVDDLEDF